MNRQHLNPINRSAIWVLGPSLSFGLILPIFALVRLEAPAYQFISDLKGEEWSREIRPIGTSGHREIVTYRFSQSGSELEKEVKKVLTPPEWNSYGDDMYVNRNGDQFYISHRNDYSCKATLQTKSAGFGSLWETMRASLGL